MGTFVVNSSEVGADLALILRPQTPFDAWEGNKVFTPFYLSSNPYTFLTGFSYNVVLLTTITASAQLQHTAYSMKVSSASGGHSR